MEHVKDIIFDRLELFNLYFINNLVLYSLAYLA